MNSAMSCESMGLITKTTKVVVPPPPKPKTIIPVGKIVGGIIGGLAGIGLIAGAVFLHKNPAKMAEIKEKLHLSKV